MSETQSDLPHGLSGRISKGKEHIEPQTPSTYLGVSITAHQTRIFLLHGENGVQDCPLVGEVFAADILHPKFDGLGIRGPPGVTDYVAQFDALSYCWGDPKCTHIIVCNDIDLPINGNLYQALRALRNPGHQSRYLWVDAICINQDDEIEKSHQVFHMLQIYQLANKVIAWLGAANDNLPPYFHRIRKHDKAGLNIIPPSFKPQANKKRGHVPKDVEFQLNAVHNLVQLHKDNIHNFERFSPKDVVQLDIIETLIETAALAASNPRDYMYGILGLTKFPARASSIQRWMRERETDIYIPIDYSADMRSILCAVTWAMLMKAGLRIIAKFKVSIQHDKPSPFVEGRQLPSWVIDWRLVGHNFATYKILKHPPDGWNRVSFEGEDATKVRTFVIV
ncbi:hypothetical protein N0V90_011196 [Kalmusia sp. IMI 367209]|nr:hypothetical protein N0V90_011196 [Kalmusia sp. IMI 367209]